MYNAHRAMAASSGRLNELLDQIRNEFESQTNRSGEYENQSKWTSHISMLARLLKLDRNILIQNFADGCFYSRRANARDGFDKGKAVHS